MEQNNMLWWALKCRVPILETYLVTQVSVQYCTTGQQCFQKLKVNENEMQYAF